MVFSTTLHGQLFLILSMSSTSPDIPESQYNDWQTVCAQ